MTRTAARTAWLALAALALSGCDFPPLPGPPPGAEQLELRGFPDTLVLVERSGYRRSKRLVIRDSGAYLVFWDSLTRYASPKPAAPPIDFGADMVIAVAFGIEPEPVSLPLASIAGGDSIAASVSSRYSIHIDRVHAHDGEVWVQVRARQPGHPCLQPHISTPVAAVRVARRDGYTWWIERGEMRCN